MTRDEIMKLEGEALNRACAELHSGPDHYASNDVDRWLIWKPSTDADHAIEFAEAMMKSRKITDRKSVV